jgi:hypothetical protein
MTPTLSIFSTLQEQDNFIFPILEDIEIPGWVLPSSSFLIACPALRSIQGSFLTAEEIPYLSHSTKTLEFAFRQGSELSILSDRPIESLRLLNTEFEQEQEKENPFSTKMMGNAIQYLKRFEFSTRNIHSILSGLLTIVPAHLRYLKVQLPLDMIEYFTSSLILFHLLYELTVSLANTNQPGKKWPIHLTPSPSLTNRPRSSLRRFILFDLTSGNRYPHLKELTRCLNEYATIQTAIPSY